MHYAVSLQKTCFARLSVVCVVSQSSFNIAKICAEDSRSFICDLFCRLGSTPELTGKVAGPCFMGAPAIMVERLFSGQESYSAVEAAARITFNTIEVKGKNAGDGIREVGNLQDLSKPEVMLHYLRDHHIVIVIYTKIVYTHLVHFCSVNAHNALSFLLPSWECGVVQK